VTVHDIHVRPRVQRLPKNQLITCETQHAEAKPALLSSSVDAIRFLQRDFSTYCPGGNHPAKRLCRSEELTESKGMPTAKPN